MSKLHFKYGAMNSGKTDTLIKAAYNYTENGLRPVVVKAKVDTKGAAEIVARAGMSRTADIIADKDTNIRYEVAQLHTQSPVNCVFIDETQFLSPEQITQLYDIAKHDNISVVAYGLRTDFMTNMFPGAKRLFELADNIEKIPTMCRCGSQAEFNCRMVDGVFVFEGDQVAIDGEQEVTYVSLCANCRSKEMGDV
ncbi:MAG: thymidine kinase [Candidatus Saccharimonadales bacterium]